MTSYAEKLKDPRWQKKRLEILDDRGWACEHCCSRKNTLHVHHVRYISKCDPWEYANRDLRVLCDKCHEEEHDGQDLETMMEYFTSVLGMTDKEILWIIKRGWEQYGYTPWYMIDVDK